MVKLEKWLLVLIVAVIAALSGLVEITPVGTDLRFAVASVVLIFALLAIRNLPLVTTGLATAVAIYVLRVLVDYYFRFPETGLAAIAWVQFPGALYYFLIGLFLYLFKIRRYWNNLVVTLLLTISADVSANLVELVIRDGFSAVHFRALGFLLAVSTIRIIWVTSIVGLIRIRQLQARQQEERLHLDKTMIMLSSLHTEAFFLKKSFREMEEVMSSAYRIYSGLATFSDPFYASPKPSGSLTNKNPESLQLEGHGIQPAVSAGDIEEISKLALNLSHKAHEIKKDFQRTLAGLDKFIYHERSQNTVTLEELVQMIIRSHSAYAQARGKKVDFFADVSLHHFTDQVYTLTSILSNLVTNSIDAIAYEGAIEIRCHQKQDYVCLEVVDSGEGIPENKLPHIFDLGYTTKYTSNGKAFTGIGLHHVSELAKQLGGRVAAFSRSHLSAENKGATFQVFIPARNIMMEGEDDRWITSPSTS